MDGAALCIDTSVLIAFLKGREPGASAVEQAVSRRSCFVTAIAVYALLFGVARAKKQIGEDALLGMLTILPFDDDAARQSCTRP